MAPLNNFKLLLSAVLLMSSGAFGERGHSGVSGQRELAIGRTPSPTPSPTAQPTHVSPAPTSTGKGKGKGMSSEDYPDDDLFDMSYGSKKSSKSGSKKSSKKGSKKGKSEKGKTA
jgi:hypothetical protein